jgi:YHS domain-containing protein
MKKLVSIFSIILFFVSVIFAQKNNKPSIFSNKEGAIKGYDAVAYFTSSKPVKGSKTITYDWKGATWHFENDTNKELFAKNPDKYAPQYGGYCAYGIAKGYQVKIEPDAWAIENGKLYLNYDSGVQKDWNKDRKGFIEKANENWLKN